MRTTIDKAGRVIIPAVIRAQLGITPGPVDIVLDGAGVRIELIPADNIAERDGRLIIDARGEAVTSDDIRELRLAEQR